MAAELGLVLYKLGHCSEAEALLRRAIIGLEPGNRTYSHLLGELLVQAPDRWRWRDELVAFLSGAWCALKAIGAGGRTWLTLRLGLPRAERGMPPWAQRRLPRCWRRPTCRRAASAVGGPARAADRPTAAQPEDWPDGSVGGRSPGAWCVARGRPARRQPQRTVGGPDPGAGRVPESARRAGCGPGLDDSGHIR